MDGNGEKQEVAVKIINFLFNLENTISINMKSRQELKRRAQGKQQLLEELVL